MSYEKVKRNRYYDPPVEFPHVSRNHAEDMEEFHLPWHRMHNAHLHDWGIAGGLEVTGTIFGNEVVIQAGVVIDGSGRLTPLSALGHGDIGANPPGGQNQEVPVPVHLPLGSQPGKTVYVTIQFSEIMRPAEGSGGRMEIVPWLRLQPVSGAGAYVDDGTAVILAIATINAAGNLTALAAEDGAITYRRRVVGQSVQELHLKRSAKTGNKVEEVVSGVIKPGTGGGLDIRVPHSGDQILLARDDGNNFNRLEVRAGNVAVKDSGGREVIKIDSSTAWLTVGAQGNDGDIFVYDNQGRQVFHINGYTATLYLGAQGNGGTLQLNNDQGAINASLDGPTGRLKCQNIDPYGDVLDIDARFVRIHGWDLCLDGRSGGNKRALVDLGNKLIVNYATDYANGVDINKLHLADHIKVSFWEERGEWNPGRDQWHTFYEQDTGLKWAEWNYTTMCEIGMYDGGTVENFWWVADNASYVNDAGNLVVKWEVNYYDTGPDWFPWHRAVFWLAFRR